MLKDLIYNEKEKIKNQYASSAERIVSDYKKEREKIEDYNGRQLLELIQNADDACVMPDNGTEIVKDKSVYVKLTKDKFIIANNGEPFSEDGVISLMYSNLSQKSMQQNKIGNKGTGFRSILSWAKSIYIKSYELSVRFSNDCARNFLDEIIKLKPSIKEKIKKYTKEEYPIATLLSPEWIDHVEDYANKYDTYIVIELIDDEQIFKSIQEQINKLDKEVLLFVHNLDSIKIISPERNETIFRKNGLQEGSIIISIEDEQGVHDPKEWLLNKRVGEYNGKGYELVVAYNEALDDKKNVLYSYFKTDVRFPFPAIIHGTFDLSGNRNELNRSKDNEYLLGQLVELLADTAIKIAVSNKDINYLTLKLLAFNSEFDPVIKDLGFEENFLKKIIKCKVFPTISGEYVQYSIKPVFYEKPYADILPAETFTKLMPYTDDKNITALIKKLRQYIYSYDFLIKSLNSVVHNLNNDKRAKLLKFLLDDYSKEINKEGSIKPFLFVDTDEKVIKDNVEVFLPEKNDIFSSIPSYVTLRFMNRYLFGSIKRELGTNSTRIVYEKLKSLNVSEYSFDPVLRRVANQTKVLCDKEPDNKEKYISEFISWLYGVYQQNKENNLPQISNTTKMPMLNRNKKIMNADEMFMGIEYDNLIGENLLANICEEKFIIHYSELGIEKKDKHSVSEFFKWMGISYFPRVKATKLNQEEQSKYIKHVYQNLKPIKLEDHQFNDIQSLKNKISSITNLEVYQVEYMNEIFENSEFEDIIVWMIVDEKIKGCIGTRTEKDSSSKLDILLKQCSYSRRINYNQLPSYILWKIKNTDWVKTKSGVKANPCKCCLAKNIINDFSPLIEVPEINYLKPIFKQYGVSKEDVEYWLNKIGVAKDFGDFTTTTVYSILLRLPWVDAEGKNARAIYKQIVQSSDEDKWEKNNSTYIEFMSEGKVLANFNGQKSYFPLDEVYYLDNRMLCEDIIRQFPILELEKRSGKQKVQSILGVKPLENISFKIADDPILHPLHKRFLQDLEVFLPYIYCYRIDRDVNHRELNALKNTKFYLCSSLNATYSVTSEEKPLIIKPYEYIYLEEDEKIYFVIEPQRFETLQNLKDDFKFCETVAEAFAGIIKVEENRKDFRELYPKNPLQRDDTLRSDLDDIKLTKLFEARKWLDICTDSKIDFWNTILRVIGNTSKLPEDEKELKTFLTNIFSLDSDLSNKLFDEVDYDNLFNEKEDIEAIIMLFKKLKIDISAYNENTVKEINLIDFYKMKIESIKNRYKRKYYSYLYTSLLLQSIDEKKTFESKKISYIMKQVEIINSVQFDPEDEFYKAINITEIELDRTTDVDLNEIFSRNRQKLKNKVIQKHSAEFIEDSYFYCFCDKPENKSLIYFGEFNFLINKIDKLLCQTKVQQDEANSETNKKSPTLEDIFKEIAENVGNGITNTNIQRPNVSQEPHNHNGGGYGGNGRPSEKQKEIIGFKGESYAYLELVDKYGNDKVVWCSEYAKKAGINEDGKDGLGYDMYYTDESGNTIYVEVKATTGKDITFIITKDEVSFGESHKDNYELMVVISVSDDEERDTLSIGNIFKYDSDETFTNNKKFFVENKDYKIKAELENNAK